MAQRTVTHRISVSKGELIALLDELVPDLPNRFSVELSDGGIGVWTDANGEKQCLGSVRPAFTITWSEEVDAD